MGGGELFLRLLTCIQARPIMVRPLVSPPSAASRVRLVSAIYPG